MSKDGPVYFKSIFTNLSAWALTKRWLITKGNNTHVLVIYIIYKSTKWSKKVKEEFEDIKGVKFLNPIVWLLLFCLYMFVIPINYVYTKGVIRIRKSKKDKTMAKRQNDRQHNGQKTEGQTTQWPKDRRTDNTMAKRKMAKGQTTIYKTLHIKLKIA